MKKIFVTPQIEICTISCEDVLTTSGRLQYAAQGQVEDRHIVNIGADFS